MEKIKIGILGTAEIAYRRFLPALKQLNDTFEYIGVASRNLDKTKDFVNLFGGQGYASYDELLEDKNINAVYIPLPPALHYEWGKKALMAGKHVLLEKPFCVNAKQTKELVNFAIKNNLALHENYMFLFHKQLAVIQNIIQAGAIGKVRLYRIAFGFPKRAANDFRYNKNLGGGALLDCGGYTLKLAGILLGDTAHVVHSKLINENENVDLYGNAVLENNAGLTAQIAFGMDNAYKCELEVWGSKGILKAPRIFTAPPDYETELELVTNDGIEKINTGVDNQFANSIEFFRKCIMDSKFRKINYKNILQQSNLIDSLQKGAVVNENY